MAFTDPPLNYIVVVLISGSGGFVVGALFMTAISLGTFAAMYAGKEVNKD